MKSRTFLSVTLCLFMLSACSFKKNSDSKNPEKIVVIEKEQVGDIISRSEVQLKFIPKLLEFGAYTLRVAWPSGRRINVGLSFEDHIEDFDNNNKIDDRIDGEIINQYDISCRSGERFKLKMLFSSKVGGQFENYEFTVDCPVDFQIENVLSSLSILPTKLTGRLFLRNGARIKLGTQKLHLENLIGLHIDGTATIEAMSNTGADGEPQIIINAKQASGRLMLDLRGADGRDGESGDERALLFEHQQLLKQNQPKPGRSGQDGDTEFVCRRLGKEGQDCSDKCSKQPTNGQPGQDGLIVGLPGLDGHNGSDTSKVLLKVSEQDRQDPFEVTVLLRPGQPGRGGLGGKGQLGAPGGLAGSNRGGRCQSASAGPAGKPAADGAEGATGKAGGCGVIEVNPELISAITLAEQSELGAACLRHKSLILKATESH